jgi:hypothetical protein
MPRRNLRRAQALVRNHCHSHYIAYREDALLASYAQTLRHLSEVAILLGNLGRR